MEEIIKELEDIAKEDFVKIIQKLYNSGVKKEMLIGLGFNEKEAKAIENIMKNCQRICDDKNGWHITKKDLIRILGNLYNSEIQEKMLIGLGFSMEEAHTIDGIMESCEIVCGEKYGWHIPNAL